MQLNTVLKGAILAVSVMVISGCNSHKSTNNSDESAMSTLGGTSINMSGKNGSSDEKMRLKMQEYQRNNLVYFDLDKYDIHSEFAQMLDVHANFLRNTPSYKVTIEGHTDERGTPEYNIALGERRANTVKMYLQGKGVSADQIAIISYGKEKPAVLGHNESAYAKNRRAVLVY